jgi:hypothetical protein
MHRWRWCLHFPPLKRKQDKNNTSHLRRNMKVEQWTLGLAALGLVTLSPALRAQQTPAIPQLVPVETTLSATTISGYVDTSAVWNPGTGNVNPAPFALNAGKQDGFNLDSVDVRIAKAQDDSQWAAGYVLELSYGPDATAIDAGAYPIRQAYVVLRTPVGNGINWQIGRWDGLLGYESNDNYKNPNFTHTYGKSFEPTEDTGLLASYKATDWLNLQAGVADTVTTTPFSANDRVTALTGTQIESKKAFTGLLTLTAPDNWGFLKGSSLYAGWDHGQGAPSHDRSEIYVGTTIMTPVSGLTVGGAYDSIFHTDVLGVDTGYFQSYAGYISYKATEKLTISGRAEYADGTPLSALADATDGTPAAGPNPLDKVLDLTGTVQYDLWDNVVSRVEIRWDHSCSGADTFGGVGPVGSGVSPDKKNDVMIAANVIYKF